MGCFLGCFGKSKNVKRRKHSHQVLPRDQRNNSCKYVQPGFSSVLLKKDKDNLEDIIPELGIRHKPEEQSNFTAKKKVTFDSNVKTYVSVQQYCGADIQLESEIGGKTGICGGKKELFANSTQSSEDYSVISSTGSYPPNHRYQNCLDSDEEYGELDCEDSDLSDVDDDDLGEELEEFYDDVDDGTVDSSTIRATAAQADDATVKNGLDDKEVKPICSNKNARNRSLYVHSILDPVENATQWEAVKAKSRTQLRSQTENLALNQGTVVSSSFELSFKYPSLSSKSICEPTKKSSQEIAVDASLSNWLISSETTPVHKSSLFTVEAGAPENSMSPGAKSVISHEDRPILGALTMEEIRQFSASSSPRKSPNKSPDEMPIIGTVGTYWNHIGSAKDCNSASSFKGIPNTTSKYREDKRVNWHVTPFETRLERALNRGAAEA